MSESQYDNFVIVLTESYISDKSFDMKYVIRQMLDPDINSRPTADQCLAFPSVRKVRILLIV